MKFVCMKCETFMLFQKVEQPAQDSLGVMFECPKCGTRFAMVTNPGETQLVSALGVKIGGRTAAPEPFELTRGTLKSSASAPAEAAASAGSCPFSAMLSGMEQGKRPALQWSQEAVERLERIPDFIRPMVKGGIEAYAARKNYQVITPAVIEESKTDMAGGLPWSSAALERLDNIPEYIRPMARLEIERIARAKGFDHVNEQVMEEAREKFSQFMSL